MPSTDMPRTATEAVELLQEMEKLTAATPEDASWRSAVDAISAMRQKYPRYAKQLDPSDHDPVRAYMALSRLSAKRKRRGRVGAKQLVKCMKTLQKKTEVVVSTKNQDIRRKKKHTKKNDAYWSSTPSYHTP